MPVPCRRGSWDAVWAGAVRTCWSCLTGEGQARRPRPLPGGPPSLELPGGVSGQAGRCCLSVQEGGGGNAVKEQIQEAPKQRNGDEKAPETLGRDVRVTGDQVAASQTDLLGGE